MSSKPLHQQSFILFYKMFWTFSGVGHSRTNRRQIQICRTSNPDLSIKPRKLNIFRVSKKYTAPLTVDEFCFAQSSSFKYSDKLIQYKYKISFRLIVNRFTEGCVNFQIFNCETQGYSESQIHRDSDAVIWSVGNA